MYTPSSKSGDAEPESRIRPAVSAGGSGLIPSPEQRRFRRRCHSTQGAAFPHSRTSVRAFFVHSGRRIRLEAVPGGAPRLSASISEGPASRSGPGSTPTRTASPSARWRSRTPCGTSRIPSPVSPTRRLAKRMWSRLPGHQGLCSEEMPCLDGSPGSDRVRRDRAAS